MRIASVGHTVFAAAMIGLGIVGLMQGNFAPVWDPVPDAVPMRAALVYLSAVLSLACGIGLLWQRTALPAARVLVASLLLWFLLFRVPDIIRAPGLGVFFAACDTAVMLAALFVRKDIVDQIADFRLEDHYLIEGDLLGIVLPDDVAIAVFNTQLGNRIALTIKTSDGFNRDAVHIAKCGKDGIGISRIEQGNRATFTPTRCAAKPPISHPFQRQPRRDDVFSATIRPTP